MQGDNLWFLDLDGCKQADGQWTPLAVSLVQAFGGHAACEVSQSKRGLHLFGWAKDLPPHGCKNVTMGMEIYHHARFVAFTDDSPTGCIDADTSAQLAGVINTFFPKTSPTSDFVDWRDIGVDESPTGATPDDDELLSIMLRSGQQTASAYFNPNHVPFAALWSANDEVLGKKWPDVTGSKGRAYDARYADSALASHLAFWCAKDCRRIEMFMRMSRLDRDKWDDREDYLPNTIINACATVRNVAKPREASTPEQIDGSLATLVGAVGTATMEVSEDTITSASPTGHDVLKCSFNPAGACEMNRVLSPLPANFRLADRAALAQPETRSHDCAAGKALS